MASKRLLLAVLAVVIIVIAASVTYSLFYNPSPQPSALEQMAVASDDLGPGWMANYHSMSFENPSCHVYAMNATYDSTVMLIICHNKSESQDWLHSSRSNVESHDFTIVNITMGDEAFLFYHGTANMPDNVNLIFIENEMYCRVLAEEGNDRLWRIDTTIWIAQLQLEKIDQYLAQHPGAN